MMMMTTTAGPVKCRPVNGTRLYVAAVNCRPVNCRRMKCRRTKKVKIVIFHVFGENLPPALFAVRKKNLSTGGSLSLNKSTLQIGLSKMIFLTSQQQLIRTFTSTCAAGMYGQGWR